MDNLELLKQLTLEEKCALVVGKDAWRTKDIERLGIPSLMMADGPHGLRKVIDDRSIHEEAVPAVCYPSLVTLASSFDTKLAGLMGESIAKEFKANQVNLILGPGINIKRHPNCGRNFEYFSEDPKVTSKMAKGYIEGAKRQGVGVCLKHYALNNQETYRMTSNSIADERAKYEIYYKAFQELIDVDPEMVMCSYNLIDGCYASENFKHLQTVLRDEFGFKGVIVSDWSAVNKRGDALIASLDLEMPGIAYSIHELIRKFKKHEIDIAYLDHAVLRILNLIDRFSTSFEESVSLDENHNHAITVASESMVLLKNDHQFFPLNENEKILLVGEMAENVRYQGGGSSHINPYKIDSIRETFVKHNNVHYAQGYHIDNFSNDLELIDELKKLAPNYDKIILVCGLTDEFESEGWDRTHQNIPENQEFVINELAKLNDNIALVLELGSPIAMPYISKVNALLNCYLGGEGLGKALEMVVFGDVNPSGRLAETFPLKQTDVPSDPFFAKGNRNVFYQESIYVGYRYFQTVNKPVLFPFGHGLSYTDFEYSNMNVSNPVLKEQSITVSIDVTNRGPIDGKEVILLFFESIDPKIPRPTRELIDFDKVLIKTGETKTVQFKVNKDNFTYYHPELKQFMTDDGVYHLQFCKNARDILMEQPITIKRGIEYTPSIWNKLESYHPSLGLNFLESDYENLINTPIVDQVVQYQRPFNINNTFEDMQNTWMGRILFNQFKKAAIKDAIGQDEQYVKMMMAAIKTQPIRTLAIFSDGKISINTAIGLVELVNGRIFKAIKHILKKD